MPYGMIDWTESIPITASNLDNMDQGIYDAYYQSGGMFQENCSASFSYSSGNVIMIQESVGGTLRRRTDLSYDGSNRVSTVRVRVYAADGTTVLTDYTDTMSYDGSSNLTVITRVVV